MAKRGRKKKKRLTMKDHPFYFWYSNYIASNMREFVKAIRNVSVQSLEHHAKNNDFSKWLRDVKNRYIAKKVEKVENEARGEELRERLLKALKGRRR